MRFKKWLLWSANNDQSALSRRLALEGLTEEDAVFLISRHAAPVPIFGPSWVNSLESVARALVSAATPAVVAPSHSHLPFAHLFTGLVEDATDGICALRQPESLSKQALASLQEMLLRRLASATAPALYQRFDLFRRSERYPGNDYGCYQAFISNLMRKDGVSALLGQQPVLARKIVTTVTNWAAAIDVFMCRLAADRESLSARFNQGVPLGRIEEVYGDLSDLHNKGQSVIRLVFSCGLEIGYKPRELSLDAAWYDLLSWLSDIGAPFLCGAPKVLLRKKYGWVEWITPECCDDPSRFDQFFSRSGSMLCLFHFLGGSDFHAENIVAKGEVPYPVDLEMLLQPWLSQISSLCACGTASAAAAQRLRDSVLSTGYLPFWTVRLDDALVKLGGVNPNQVKAPESVGFRFVNSDRMEPCRHFPAEQLPANLPRTNKSVADPAEYGDQLKAGYEAMYWFIKENERALMSEPGPLSAFASCSARVVLRPTHVYDTLLIQSVRPPALANGIDASLPFEYLAQWCDREITSEALRERQILQAEKLALCNGDVPYFISPCATRSLVLPDGEVLNGYFELSGLERIEARHTKMGETDLADQLNYISYAYENIRESVYTTMERLSLEEMAGSGETLKKSSAIDLAAKLAELLKDEAVFFDGGAAWIGSTLLPGDSRANMEVAGPSLYRGSAGIGLFLGELYRCTGDRSHRALSLAAFKGAKQELEASQSSIRKLGLGGGTGLGSIIYALARSAWLLNEEILVQDAQAASELITEEWISTDVVFDVMLGSAGALLGLLALEEVYPNRGALNRANMCGRHLVANQVRLEGGCGAWRTVGNRLLAGMSHGTAGIAMALLRLYKKTNDASLHCASNRAAMYEKAIFSDAAQNWPDLRSDKLQPNQFRSQWCHGAVGIGLARISDLSVRDDENALVDLKVAIEAALRWKGAANDSLCCGTFGSVDLLYSAGLLLGDADLISGAQRAAACVAREATERDRFLFHVGPNRYNPGLFTGIAGIGYELLRLVDGEVPSVLIWGTREASRSGLELQR